MFSITKILFTLWFLQFSENSVPSPKPTSNLLANYVNDILTNTVKNHENIYLINSDLQLNLPVIKLNITNSFKKFFKIPPHPHAYVIETDADFPHVTQKLFYHGLLNPREKLIILTNRSNLTDIFSTATAYFIHKFLIIQRQQLLFYPTNSSTTIEDFDFSSFSFDRMEPESPRDLSVVYVPLPPFIVHHTQGIMPEILNLIASKLGIQVRYTESNRTDSEIFVDDDGHATGIISELEARKFDVVISTLIRFSIESLFYDPSVYIAVDEAKFVVARAYVVDDWGLFYKEFTLPVWLIFIATLLICYLVMYAIQRWWNRNENSPLLINIIQIILEGSSTIRSDSTPFNAIFISVLLGSTIFTNVYKSRQFYFMRTNRAHQLVNSAEDVVKYKVKSALHHVTIRFYQTSIHPIEKYLLEADPFVCSVNTECLKKIVEDKDRIGVDVLKHLKHYITSNYIDSEGKSMIHFLEGLPKQDVFFTTFFLKGHPTFERFEKMLYSVRESGLSDYIDKKIDRNQEKAMALAQPSKYRATALTLNTLRSTFCVYTLLVFVSFVVCLLEVKRIL